MPPESGNTLPLGTMIAMMGHHYRNHKLITVGHAVSRVEALITSKLIKHIQEDVTIPKQTTCSYESSELPTSRDTSSFEADCF
jgi:hypothetical protein